MDEVKQCCGVCENAIVQSSGALFCASLATEPEHINVGFADGQLCPEFERL